MTCPVQHERTLTSVPATHRPARPDGAVERFDDVAGSIFLALFAAALYDQTMLPGISAALVDTGRIRNSPWQPATRTAASDQLMMCAEDAERRAEGRRLRQLHRDVHGVGADGTRYSALNPVTWNWIVYSTFFMHLGAYRVLTGDAVSDAQGQLLWDVARTKLDALELPGQSGFIEDYAELRRYYDTMAAESLQRTQMLDDAVAVTLRPPRPDFVPYAATPAWVVIAPLIGHVAAVLGFGIMEPAVREQLPYRWTRRHDLEFAALAIVARTSYRVLPQRLTDTPLARNRRQYQRLVKRYKDIGLTSFAVR
jgi:uncharacterized protein (DUF2236 family)